MCVCVRGGVGRPSVQIRASGGPEGCVCVYAGG